MSKAKKKRIVMAKLSTFAEARAFDEVFWHRVGAQGRFEAMWSMLRDFAKIKGIRGFKPRLQRSVQAFKQAPG